MEREHFVKMCPCTIEDWECDYGFRAVAISDNKINNIAELKNWVDYHI